MCVGIVLHNYIRLTSYQSPASVVDDIDTWAEQEVARCCSSLGSRKTAICLTKRLHNGTNKLLKGYISVQYYMERGVHIGQKGGYVNRNLCHKWNIAVP